MVCTAILLFGTLTWMAIATEVCSALRHPSAVLSCRKRTELKNNPLIGALHLMRQEDFSVLQTHCTEPTVGRKSGRLARKTTSLQSLETLLALRGGGISLPLPNDLVVSIALVGEVYIWLKFWTTLAVQGYLPSTLTRKIIHAGSAPLFMLHWPLYSDTPYSALVAGVIPLLQIARLYIAGSVREDVEGARLKPSSDLVAAVSRTGRNEEALGGPLLYSLVLFACTVFFFRSSPVGVVAVSQMACGDGFADIIGRRFGRTKWPFAPTKSLAGTSAFVLGGFLCSWLVLSFLHWTGYLPQMHFAPQALLLPLFIVSVLSAAVELLPGVDDNLSVPVVAALATYFLLVLGH